MTKIVTSTTETPEHKHTGQTPLKLSIIGAGKLGKTLGRLWQDQHQFSIADVLTQGTESANQACDFIGAGAPCDKLSTLGRSEAFLIACPDDKIALNVAAMAEQGLFHAHSPEKPCIVFHCSGALSSEALSRASAAGAIVASIHPAHSFASPSRSLSEFSGSTCAYEGDQSALDYLIPVFQAIGARTLPIDKPQKSLYHAGSVMACNYLVPLIEASLECFERAGIPKDASAELLQPLMHATIDNVLEAQSKSSGEPSYLTGPIARGDVDTIERQQSRLASELPHLADTYRILGLRALEVARRQGGLSESELRAMAMLLDKE